MGGSNPPLERSNNMKLLTKAIEKDFEKYPFGSQDGKGRNAKVLVKYFNPYGAGTWIITEAEKQEDGDYLMYGWCDLGFGEFGYVPLSDIQSVGYLERDLYSSRNKTLGQVMRETGISIPEWL